MSDWKKGPYVRTETDYLEEENQTDMDIVWFSVKSKGGTTEEEKREKIEAIREQIRLGILNEKGIPVGYEPPKPKMNKWERKRFRELERENKKRKGIK